MLLKVKRGWEIPEREATPESVFLNRRDLVKAMGMGALIAAGGLGAGSAFADESADPSAGLYPVKRNERYTLDRPITAEKLSTTTIISTNIPSRRTSTNIPTSSRSGPGRCRSAAWWKSPSPSTSTIC
jgi:hypothetical protein